MKFEFRNPSDSYGVGTRTYPAIAVPGVVFIDSETPFLFELVIAMPKLPKAYDIIIHINMERNNASMYIYDFFNNLLKDKSEEVSGPEGGYGSYPPTTFKNTISAWWGVKKRQPHDNL